MLPRIIKKSLAKTLCASYPRTLLSLHSRSRQMGDSQMMSPAVKWLTKMSTNIWCRNHSCILLIINRMQWPCLSKTSKSSRVQCMQRSTRASPRLVDAHIPPGRELLPKAPARALVATSTPDAYVYAGSGLSRRSLISKRWDVICITHNYTQYTNSYRNLHSTHSFPPALFVNK